MTFANIPESVETTEDERKLFDKLRKTSEWLAFVNLTERYILTKTRDLLTGTEREKESAIQELYQLRGFTRFWNILKGRVNRKDDEKEKDAE